MNRLVVALVGTALLVAQFGCNCCPCRPTCCQRVGRGEVSQSDYYTVAKRPSTAISSSVDSTTAPLPRSLKLNRVPIPRAPIPWEF
jgi:hypothetical protein